MAIGKKSDAALAEFRLCQTLNAVSILIANIFVAFAPVGQIAETLAFADDVQLIKWAALVHCPCSVVYHLHLTLRCFLEDKVPQRSSATRVLDLAGTHCCCVAMGWALSHGSVLFFCANFVMNFACVISLVLRQLRGGEGGERSEHIEFLRLGVCSAIYPTAILMRGHAAAFCFSFSLLAMMGGLMCAHPLGHCLSRVPLTLYMCSILESAAKA
mmetsp:Transcript_85700/g.276584  ORF Transcript_85700/g.276584 Transcript_85700/m.276584 type:complete len:214 (+) Transcript_85700:51-692(+)